MNIAQARKRANAIHLAGDGYHTGNGRGLDRSRPIKGVSRGRTPNENAGKEEQRQRSRQFSLRDLQKAISISKFKNPFTTDSAQIETG